MARRPNILLIMTDQHRADHLGCAGNPIVRTPNLDALAARGRRFTRMHVAIPVCTPNRISMLTGRMPSAHGARFNGIPMALDQVGFVELLRVAGWRTGLIGKSHLQNFLGRPPAITFETEPGLAPPPPALREASRTLRAGDAYRAEESARWQADPAYRVPPPYYGFEHVELATDHSDLCGGDYEAWLRAQGADPDALRGRANAIPDPRYSAPQAWRTRVPEHLYPTAWIAGRAEAFLAAAPGDEPFFLQVSFPDPHHPFTPPGRYWDMYDPDAIPLPESFGKGDLPPIRAMRAALADGSANREGHDAFAVTEREAREIIALTYGMITMVDDAIGRVLAALEASGRARDTIVVFVADHGDFMGDHGIMLKLLLHSQGLVRVPFLWADPALPGGDTDESLASSIDLAPTILRRCGLQPFNGMQGRDLLDAAAPEPEGLLIEEDSQRSMVGHDGPQRVRSFVTRRWRMTLRLGLPWGELYDLAADPHETRNLWDDPAHAETRARLTEAMLLRMIALQDRSPLPTGRA
jgi:arylsulfatase A-like enzyme